MKCEKEIALDRDAGLSSAIMKAAFISRTTWGNLLCHECESENLWTQTAIIKDFTNYTLCKQTSATSIFF